MLPSDRHSLEARRSRISENMKPPAQGDNTGLTSAFFAGDFDTVELFNALAPGVEFISKCPIRVMPKIAPKPGPQMRAALMQSRLVIPGIRFRVIGKAAKTPSQWWRVEVIGEQGETLHKGFVIQKAISGKIAA